MAVAAPTPTGPAPPAESKRISGHRKLLGFLVLIGAILGLAAITKVDGGTLAWAMVAGYATFVTGNSAANIVWSRVSGKEGP